MQKDYISKLQNLLFKKFQSTPSLAELEKFEFLQNLAEGEKQELFKKLVIPFPHVLDANF